MLLGTSPIGNLPAPPQILIKPAGYLGLPQVLAGGIGSGQKQFGAPVAGAPVVPSQVPAATPAALTDQCKSPLIDLGASSQVSFQADLERISGQANFLANVATPVTFQVEGSNDGNRFQKVTSTIWPGINTTAAVQNTDGPLFQNPQGKCPYRYLQTRLVYAATQVLGSLITPPTTNVANCAGICYAPDETVLFMGFLATPYLQASPVTIASIQTTGHGTEVLSAALAATGVNALDVIGPFNNTYYVLCACAATPFFAIVPYTAAGGFGTAITSGIVLTGAALCAKWVPGVISQNNQTAFIGVTGAPGMVGISFNIVNQTASLINTQTSSTSVALPVPGPNVNGLDVALDGSFMVTAESVATSTVTSVHLYTLNVNANPTSPITGYAPNPNIVVGAASKCVAIHPSGEAFGLGSAGNIYFYQVYRNSGSYQQAPYTNPSPSTTATNPAAFTIGPRSAATATTLTAVTACAFSHDGGTFGVQCSATPFFKSYPYADFGTASLGTANTGATAIVNASAGLCLTWSPDDAVVMVGNTSIAAGAVSGWAFLMCMNIGEEMFQATYN